MKSKKTTPASTPIISTHHADKRANIPTEELRDFVADEEKAPRTILYPRDPSLDPQLVWKGKDEQDQHPLEVPAVPIYIQEKISPQAIIENVFVSHNSLLLRWLIICSSRHFSCRIVTFLLSQRYSSWLPWNESHQHER
jgi:hypothetical protein